MTGVVDEKGGVFPLDEAIYSSGFGKDVFDYGKISDDTIGRNIVLISELAHRAERMGAEKILVCGTSALRRASNAAEFIRTVEEEIGLKAMIVSGQEEALLTYMGYASGGAEINEKTALADIGGGSCEIIYIEKSEIIDTVSLELGAVDLTERYIDSDPPDISKFRRMKHYIISILSKVELKLIDKLVLSGGTATALAALSCGLTVYNGSKIENYALIYENVIHLQNRFLSMNLQQRKELLEFDPGRANVIIAGAAIMVALLALFEKRTAFVTHRGLRYGMLSNLVRQKLVINP